MILAGAAGLLAPVSHGAQIGALGRIVRRVAVAVIALAVGGLAVRAIASPQVLFRGLQAKAHNCETRYCAPADTAKTAPHAPALP